MLILATDVFCDLTVVVGVVVVISDVFPVELNFVTDGWEGDHSPFPSQMILAYS